MPTVKELKKTIRDYKAKGHCPTYSHLTKAGLLALTNKLNINVPEKARKAPKARKAKGTLTDPKVDQHINLPEARRIAWIAYVKSYTERIRKQLRDLDMTSFRKAANRLHMNHKVYRAPAKGSPLVYGNAKRRFNERVGSLPKKYALRQRDFKLFEAVANEWGAVAKCEYIILRLKIERRKTLPEIQKKHSPEILRQFAVANKHIRNLKRVLKQF